MQYTPLSNKAKPVLWITAVLQALCTMLVLCAGTWGFSMQIGGLPQKFLMIPLAATVFLCLLWAILTPFVRFRRYKYMIADDRIEIVEGLFYIRRTIVPIDRIHQIDITRGPIDNRFGLAKVTVTTAGAKATMRFLELDKAEAICESLNRTIIHKLREQKGEDHV